MADPKTYNLKQIEHTVLQQQQNAIISSFVSFIAIERLGIEVTPNTKFEIAPDFSSVTITEDDGSEPGIVETPVKGGK